MSNFIPNIHKLELCLTYRCNVRCKNCLTLCTQAPFIGDLSIESINKILVESVEIGHVWESIILHGGEPTLHPKYLDICKILSDYKNAHNNGMTLHACSNGSNDFVNTQLEQSAKMGIKSEVSVKIGTNKRISGEGIPYVPVNESPQDLNMGYTVGCYMTAECGICYNYKGFFECSAAAAAARVFDYDPLCTSVKDITAGLFISAFPSHCGHCGFAFINRRRVIEQTNTRTWEEAFIKYKTKHEKNN